METSTKTIKKMDFKNMFKIETYVMLPEATEDNIIQFSHKLKY